MTINISTTVIRGVNLEFYPVIHKNPIKHYVVPKMFAVFEPLIKTNFSELMNAFLAIEKQFYDRKEHKTFRQNLLTKPGISKLYATVPSQREDIRIVTDAKGITKISSDTFRLDDYFEPPVCLIVWITSIYIAFAPSRDEMAQTIMSGDIVPAITTQMCQKTRKAETNKISFLPQLPIPKVTTFFPELKDTFFDPDFVVSKEGFACIREFWNSLSQDGNYILVDTVTDVNKGKIFPRFDSGMQVTFCSLNTAPSPENLNLTGHVELLQVNSFSRDIKIAHFYDAFVVGLSHYQDALHTTPFLLNQENFQIKVPLTSSSNIFRYIICRCDGSLINDSQIDDDMYSDEVSSKLGSKSDSIPSGKESKKRSEAKKAMNKTSGLNEFVAGFTSTFKHYRPIVNSIGSKMFTSLAKDLIQFRQTRANQITI